MFNRAPRMDDICSREGSEQSNHDSVSDESNYGAIEEVEVRTHKGKQARACAECNRKKIKCDKRNPRCSLCARTGHECFYPKKRRRPTRIWQIPSSPQRLLDAAGQEGLDQILDQVDFAILQKAIQRRNETAMAASDPSVQTQRVLSQGAVSLNHQGQLMDSDGAGVDRGRNFNSAALYEQSETRFFNDVFDPSLGSWLTEGLMDMQSIDSLQDSLGEIQTFSLSRLQDPFAHQEVDAGFQFGFLPPAYPQSTNQNSTATNRYSLMIPASVVDETIDAFFRDISGWVPLFHRPNFYKKYKVHEPQPDKYQNLALEDCLILNSICALAARFSTSSYFANLPPKGRAEPFLNQAAKLFQDAMQLDAVIQPSISLLQGLILLGWYHQVCGSSGRCGNLIGISCRLAYDLGLNNIDRELLESKATEQWTSEEEWSKSEELRRAWWLVWELDMFSGTILRRPHTIDKTQINVLLPVSDQAWFSNTPVASVPVTPDPLQMWKTLKDTPNQHDRAWFLVASFIRAVSHDLINRRHTSAQLLSDFQSSIACFSLILPKRFHLSKSCLSFDESNFADCNWIICTHLILQSSRASIRLFCHRKFPDLLEVSLETLASEDEKLLCRIMREWDPDYIAQTCPLVVATLLGPSAINAKCACEQATNPDESRPMYLEMLKLVLDKIGTYWQIGASVLELVQLLEARRSITELVNPRKNDLEHLPLLLPKNDEVAAN